MGINAGAAPKARDQIRQITIRLSVYQRLSRWIDNQKIRPITTDVVTEAVSEWLDRREARERNFG